MRIHHLALRVRDLEQAAAFYTRLGLPQVRRLDGDGGLRSVWLAAGDTVLMLETELRGDGARDGSGHLLAFAVDDLEAWEARLEAAGVPVVDRTDSTLYVRDPDGHRVGLSVFPFDPPRSA